MEHPANHLGMGGALKTNFIRSFDKKEIKYKANISPGENSAPRSQGKMKLKVT